MGIESVEFERRRSGVGVVWYGMVGVCVEKMTMWDDICDVLVRMTRCVSTVAANCR